MFKTILVNTYLIAVGLAFMASLTVFIKKSPLHLRFFSILLGITFFVELVASKKLHIYAFTNNYGIYDFFTLLEFPAYAWYYQRIIRIPWIRRLIIGFMIAFPIFWSYTHFLIKTAEFWNVYVMLVGPVFTVFFALGYYYELLYSNRLVKLTTHTEFWIATGMLIYYSCLMPYFGSLNYLIQNYRQLANSIIYVSVIIDSVMYIVFTYAFLCRITPRK